ncbi:MAG: hypothetical protein Q8M76_16480 [Spirochaetaceae bacterium]|nr:hypothetical protein [Spirochaetaceae bacterium]
MRKHERILALVLLTAVVAAGCGLGLGGAGNAAGTARFAVVRLSPDLLLALGATGATGDSGASRTFLIADRVDFRVYDSEYNLKKTWSSEPSLVAGPGEAPAVSETALEPGSYAVEVDVYNVANAIGARHTASGYQTFTVVAGTMTDVDIFCVPSADTRVELDEGIESQAFTLSESTVVDGTQTISQAGSEQWFSFIASAESTTVGIQPAIMSQAVLVGVAFDSTGKYMFGESIAPQARFPGELVAFTLVTEPFTRYFVAVLDLGDEADSNRAFTVLTAPSVPPDLAILADGSWTNDLAIAQGETRWFFFDADPEQNYRVSWDDASEGSGAATADVLVTFYTGNYGDSDRTNLEFGEERDVAFSRHLLAPAQSPGYRVWLSVYGMTFGDFKLLAAADAAPTVAIEEAVYVPGGPSLIRIRGAATDGDEATDIYAIHIDLPAKELSWMIYYDEMDAIVGNSAFWTLELDAATVGLQVGHPYNFEVWAEDLAACHSETETITFVLVSTTVAIE